MRAASRRTTPLSRFSMQAYHARPLERTHIVKLKELKERMRGEKFLHDDYSLEAFGFNFKAWLKAEVERSPMDFTPGTKESFGSIRTSLDKGVLTFQILKRTSEKMKQRLYEFINNRFDLASAQVFIKRKTYKQVSGIHSTADLDEYITAQMRGKRQLNFRVQQ